MVSSSAIRALTVIVALTTLLVSGCKKPPATEPAAGTYTAKVLARSKAKATDVALPDTNATAAPAYWRGQDLGVVQFTNRSELQLRLGDGKSCTVKPVLLDPQRLQLTMTLESKLADGKPQGIKILTVMAKPNQPFEVDFGTIVFHLTPEVVRAAH